MLRSLSVLLLVAVLLAVPAARAADGCEKCSHAPPAAATAATPAGDATDVTLVDEPLLDQDGRPVRFVTDVLGDRIVVIDFVFTSCTTVCPVLSAIFSGLQPKLGDALGKDVRLVSVSLDPARDTPARLREHLRKHGAGPGWTFVTGEAVRIEKVLRGLGAYTPRFVDHPPMVLVGDPRTGAFTRHVGFPRQEDIVARVQALRDARAALTRTTHEARR